jgi:hypothetical protein
MPPAAISRSSTYFPKICGNIAPHKRSSVWLFPLFLACAAPEPIEKTLAVRVYELPGCPLPRTADGELVPLTVELHALGDFRASNQTADFVRLDQRGQKLPFPAATRAVEARVAHERGTWIGYGEPRDDAVEISLWPDSKSCVLAGADPARGYPGAAGGQALGYAPAAALVLAAGGSGDENSAIVGALGFSVPTGAVVAVGRSPETALREPRAFASVSDFGDRVLVAGGENPLEPEGSREPRKTAEVYDPGRAGFEPSPIELLAERTRHAALTTKAGSTLLIGGRNRFGALDLIEAVSPDTHSSAIAGLARLQAARIEPSALVLSDDRIFVGGGYTGTDSPVALFEWLSADASSRDGTELRTFIPVHHDRAFAAMPGGGLLAVGGCEARLPLEGEDCSMCRRGCPPAAGYDAFWVSADGGVSELDFDVEAPQPILLPASDGRPWLVAGAEERALFRFDPWTATFEPARADLDLSPLPDSLEPPPVSLGPDAFVWLANGPDGTELVGARLGTRGRYAEDFALVAQPSQGLRHLAPDRPPNASVVYDGLLTLNAEAGDPPTIYVTDADYQDVTLRIQLESGPPPLVALDQRLFGDGACPWVNGDQPPTERNQPTFVRRGSLVELSYAGVRVRCPGPEGRVTLGIRSAQEGITRIRRIDVRRAAE